MKKVPTNKSFVKSNLLRYKSHNTHSIPAQFIRNNSTVTKHLDYYVWKDMSECVARRCDDTVDKTRVISCVLKHLFLAGGEQPKKSANESPSTVFGKHCECNAQKCTHLKRLPPLASHLLLLSHCVLTQHEGQKKSQDHMADSGSRTKDAWHYRTYICPLC